MKKGEEAFGYLLVTANPMLAGGSTGSAVDLVEERLSIKRWPLYEGTRYRSRIGKGARVAFYVGGRRRSGGCIVGRARVQEPVVARYRTGRTDPPQYLTDTPVVILELDEIEMLNPGISFVKRLPQLSICPDNLKNWGSLLQGGTRAFSESDWNILLETTGCG